jgi:hypothetical protein
MICTMRPFKVAATAIALMTRGEAPVSRSKASARGALEAASSAGGTETTATQATRR